MSAVPDIAVPGPVLRYHGGKWKVRHWVIEHFPRHRVYVEPFCGGAAVLLAKPRSRMEVINDLDGEIVNVFRVLRDPVQAKELERMVVLTPYARDEFDLSYEPCDDPVEQARRTITRGFLGCSTRGTSGGHRTGFRYCDNAGTCAQKVWAGYPDRIKAFCERLQAVVIENRPAIEIVRGRDKSSDGPKALYYVDPPYVHSTRREISNGRAYRHEMTDDDHRELAQVLRSVRGMVVLSGYNCELYEELYGDWVRRDKRAYADGAQARVESLWLNPAAAGGLQGRLIEVEGS